MPVPLFSESFTKILHGNVIFLRRLLGVDLPFHPEHFARAGNEQKRFRRHSIVALAIIRRNTTLVSKGDDPFPPVRILKGERLINWTGSVPSTEGNTKETALVDRLGGRILNEASNLGDKRMSSDNLWLHRSLGVKRKSSVPTPGFVSGKVSFAKPALRSRIPSEALPIEAAINSLKSGSCPISIKGPGSVNLLRWAKAVSGVMPADRNSTVSSLVFSPSSLQTSLAV